jgi:hypothetical protein
VETEVVFGRVAGDWGGLVMDPLHPLTTALPLQIVFGDVRVKFRRAAHENSALLHLRLLRLHVDIVVVFLFSSTASKGTE